MFKTISAALLAVSVLAAPAFAAGSANAPVKTPVKTNVTKTSMHSHHRHYRHHHHHKMGAIKSHAKVGSKHIDHAAKHG